MGFRYLPHTADLKASIESNDLEALYADAVALVRHALVGDSAVIPNEERQLHLGTDEPQERFFRFVRELLFLYDSEGYLPARFLPGEPTRVRGELFDPVRHHSERQIKALTRHEFGLSCGATGCRAVLLFDL